MKAVQQLLALLFIIGALVAAFSHFWRPKAAAAPEGPPGWHDLILCSYLTSFDSKKSLTLSDDFGAELTDNTSDGDAKVSKGKWSLINAERHIYRIDTPGAAGAYVLVSPPDADGCTLAAGSIDLSDMRRSWFSAAVNPNE